MHDPRTPRDPETGEPMLTPRELHRLPVAPDAEPPPFIADVILVAVCVVGILLFALRIIP